ncbi:MAG: preprotein translocase subunit YajC [Planctomycetaceae bacterium]|nr:preprotein translocase subunit YajC [Planctomycetaceae bacterium]
MNMYWILAESNTPAKDVVKADDINAQQQTATTTKTTADANGVAAPVKKPQPAYQTFIFLGLMVVLLYFMMFRGPKKRQQQQDQMVKALKKNDRVQTIGGILGTILDVSDTEVTLKIDESNNTKIKVVPSAISKVLG